MGLIPGSQRSSGGANDNPLQYSCLKNPHGQRSLAGSLWGRKELGMTERLSIHRYNNSYQLKMLIFGLFGNVKILITKRLKVSMQIPTFA